MKIKNSFPYLKLFIAGVLLLLLSGKCTAARSIDSLRKVLKTSQADTSKANTINALVLELITIGHYPQADSLLPEELRLSEDKGYKKGIADATLNKGILNYYQGLYPQGLDYLFKSQKEYNDIKNKHGAALSILYIGYIYEGQEEYEKALNTFNQASGLLAALNDDDYNATAIINMGKIYTDYYHDSEKAKKYLSESLELFQKAGDDDGVASALKDLGRLYLLEKDYENALNYLEKGKTIFEKLNDTEGLAQIECTIGKVYFEQEKFKEALEYAEKSEEQAKEIRSYADTKDAELLISQCYSVTGKAVEAFGHFKAYVSAKDSLTNEENTKKSIQAEMSFEFERKQSETQAAQDKKDALQQLQSRKQQIVIYSISGILLLFLALAIFAYRSYLQKQRANKELDIRNKKIEAAYSIIEEKNKEITDSINYAKRIQHAILPDTQQIEKYFPNSFVLFRPKDIVSGDFYFFHPTPSQVFIAAADCTGHGVPGAFMSMIGSEKLHDAVQQNSSTGEILKKVNTGIRKSLHQSEEYGTTRDGMDIALCALSTTGNGHTSMQFSGANRPLWIIRKGTSEIEEIKPDKKAIGGFTEEVQSFESQTIELKAGDTFYVFTDGYTDQFGGPQGKKLSTKKFREYLLSIQSLTMTEQYHQLEAFIESWKADKEQLDDILVIGVRI